MSVLFLFFFLSLISMNTVLLLPLHFVAIIDAEIVCLTEQLVFPLLDILIPLGRRPPVSGLFSGDN